MKAKNCFFWRMHLPNLGKMRREIAFFERKKAIVLIEKAEVLMKKA
jgi:hypothetical protein